jgi:hypothetical protein
MRWDAFEDEAPAFARLGMQLFGDPGVVLVVTVRRDGSPRLSPVEPLFWRGDLWLSMGWGTRKAQDLSRLTQVLVHNVITNREGPNGEYKVRGRALAENDAHVREEYAVEVARMLGWNPEPGRFHLFRLDVEDVTYIRWDPANNDQYVSRWPTRTEFVRRGTSATSVGLPEPFSEFFNSEALG